MEELPPLPEFAKGDWSQASDVISFSGPYIFPHGGGPEKYTREIFIRGAARMLYGDRADEVVEHWRKLNGEAP